MESNTIKGLVKKRGIYIASLTRMKTFLDNYDSGKDSIKVECRLRDLPGLRANFDQVQEQLELNDEVDDHTQTRELFEDNYYTVLGRFETLLKSIKSSDSVATNSMVNNVFGAVNNVQLPKIPIPQFSGDFKDWTSFKDTFDSLIVHNPTITDVQRLHYLLSALKGEARQLIQNIPVSNENFSVAWDLVKNRYDNPRLIAVRHIHELLSPNPVFKDSSPELRHLLNHMTSNKNALEALKLDVSLFELMLTQIMLNNVDAKTKREFEILSASKQCCGWKDLVEFLETRCQALEVINVNTQSNIKAKPKFKDTFKYNEHQAFSQAYVSLDNTCKYCSQSHVLYHCDKFKGLSIQHRLEFVKSKNLCFNCLLTTEHRAPQCKGSYCRLCKGRHHTLLHATIVGANEDTVLTPAENQIAKSTTTGSYCSFHDTKNVHILLATAVVHVRDSRGTLHKARCLLDSCSQSNYVSERLVQRLNLRKTRNPVPIQGISGISHNSQHCVKLSISSITSEFSSDVHCLVLSKITNALPGFKIDITNWNLPDDIVLADPEFHTPGNIDILLGTEVFFDVLKNCQKSRPGNWPVLQDTELGFILSGKFEANFPRTESSQNYFLHNEVTLDQQLTKFWELEEIPNRPRAEDEDICETHFQKTTLRDTDGRFIVSLPFKENSTELGESLPNATSRFHFLENRFVRQPVLAKSYKDFMNEYEELNHMEESREAVVNLRDIYYIPHHAVFKESSTTTKLRVVFDCSSKTTNGLSLNDLLLKGPTLQQDLYSIVLRFRTHPIVFMADIEKMYRNVLVNPDHRRFQHILWRSNTEEPIRSYQLRTLTYGMVPSSYLATRCLLQLAYEEEARNPQLARILKEDFYMDDVLTGAKNIDDALRLERDLIRTLSMGGFPLRKFSSNHPALLEAVPLSCRETQPAVSLDKDSGVKALGILWHPTSDNFFITTRDFSVSFDNTPTKRQVISTIASVFDPLGLIGPIVVSLKMFMQDLWSHNLQWDTPLPRSLVNTWCKLRSQLPTVRNIQIERYVLSFSDVKEIQMHTFCDASEKAYGCCIYLRTVNSKGNVAVKLLCAKSRVAPLKKTTLPRLELCAAVLAAKLVHKTTQILEINISSTFYWTDSAIVLGWLSSPASRWKTFVAHRVSEIQELSIIGCWRHVSSEDNPADLISRGTNANMLQQSQLWWQGPMWLKQSQPCWHESIVKTCKGDMPEERKSAVTTLAILIDYKWIIERFSRLSKLVRVLAYCRRFIHNSRHSNKMVGTLSDDELKMSLKFCIKAAQFTSYQREIEALKKGEEIPKTSHLLNLHPFLDQEDILRVGGRLNQADLPFEIKHQMILPPHHHLTMLLINAEHLRLLHAGPELLISSLRHQYWIPRIRQVVRCILHKCVACAKLKAATSSQLMGQYPSVRVQVSRPFQNVGVDYAGPLLMKEGSVRSKIVRKCYIALFVCMTTKAVHIELVSSLSSKAFIATMRRFTARRGKCSNVYSDNGTNFVKASKELQELYRLFATKDFKEDMENYATNEKFKWHFVPPSAPHFGGLWEANIKCMKYHLRRTVGAHVLTYEELCTLLYQIEACLNSRPLTVLTENPDDPLPLTPGHFLIGTPLTSLPEPDLNDVPVSYLTRWERLQHFLQLVWKRWSTDYLHGLQQRLKWKSVQKEVLVGTVVVLKDENTSPLQWKMAVVTKTYPGADGLVRVVDVKTSNGILKRALTKLVPLPIER